MKHKLAVFVAVTLACAAVVAAVLPPGLTNIAPPGQVGSAEDDVAFLASQAQRELWMEQVREARVQAALHGIEAGRAGFHLIRPSDDPYLGSEYSDLGCSGNVYCWDYPMLRYPTREYSRHNWPGTNLPIVPSPTPFCELSLDRVFTNKLATLSIENGAVGLKQVVATFPRRSIEALNLLMEPKRVVASNDLLDWFGTPRTSLTEITEMRVVLVSENLAYIPFVIQDVVAQGTGPTTVVVADSLSEQEANDLVLKFDK